MTNGTRLFVEGDESTPWARRFRDIMERHATDLGGAETLSQAKLSLIRRIAFMTVELERIEAERSTGSELNFDLYQRAANSLARSLKALGLERVSRDITPDGHVSDHFLGPRS